MFTSSSVWLGTSVCTPGIAHDRPQVHVLVELEPDLQQQVALEDPRLHARVADRAEEDRVESRASRSSSSSGSTSPVRRYRSAPRSNSTSVDIEASPRTASSTFRPSPTTSGPVPSPADHADRGRNVVTGSTSFVLRCVLRLDLQRAVDRREVRAGARLDDVGRDAAAGHPPPVDVELHDDVTKRVGPVGHARHVEAHESASTPAARCDRAHRGVDQTVADRGFLDHLVAPAQADRGAAAAGACRRPSAATRGRARPRRSRRAPRPRSRRGPGRSAASCGRRGP